jgi:putative ABC transport system permease protein
VGGVGVANATASFVDLKRPAIATLKCLGAKAGTVFRVYLFQILILAFLGIAIGLVIGALMPFAARSALADIVPVSAFGIYPAQLALAALYGVLVTLTFALGPLGRARQMPATSLFADRALGSSIRPPLSYILAQVIALICLAVLAIEFAGDQRLAYFYVLAVAVAFFVLRLVALLIMAAARRVGTIRRTTLRLAVRNIHRPGALTPSVVLSLGAWAHFARQPGTHRHQSSRAIERRNRRQGAGLLLSRHTEQRAYRVCGQDRGNCPGGEVETVPMLRGRFVAGEGCAASEIKPGEGAAWALRGDRGVTYSDTCPRTPRSRQANGGRRVMRVSRSFL